MEKHVQSFDICIICALPEEARAFLEVVQQQCGVTIEDRSSPRYRYSYRFATIRNNENEPLNLHISWPSRPGSQDMTVHLSNVLDEYQPRIAIMTGICAGDAQQVRLGDLVVAERTFTYDSGKFTRDEFGRRVHEHDTMTYQLTDDVLRFLGLFDDWKPLVAGLVRPVYSSEQPQRREIARYIKAMASGSAVRADHPFKDVQVPVRGTVAIDMEGAAFGFVMSRYPLIRWLVVKGVCDYADQDKNNAYHDYAARASALYALSFILAYVTNERCPDRTFLTPPPKQPKHAYSPFFVVVLILMLLILLGGGLLSIYRAATGHLPWNAFHGQPTSIVDIPFRPISLPNYAYVEGTLVSDSLSGQDIELGLSFANTGKALCTGVKFHTLDLYVFNLSEPPLKPISSIDQSWTLSPNVPESQSVQFQIPSGSESQYTLTLGLDVGGCATPRDSSPNRFANYQAKFSIAE